MFTSFYMHNFVCSLKERSDTIFVTCSEFIVMANKMEELKTMGWIYWALVNAHFLK